MLPARTTALSSSGWPGAGPHVAPSSTPSLPVASAQTCTPDERTFPHASQQAQIAPTAVAVLGAPTAESLLGSGGTGGRRLQQVGEGAAAPLPAPAAEASQSTGNSLLASIAQANREMAFPGTGRRLHQGGESVAAQLLAPIAESLGAEQPGTGRRLHQGESTIAQLVAPFTESLPGIGRKLQQAGESIAAQLLAPIAESLPGTGRKLKQGGESIAAQLLAPIAESLPGTGRRLQQGGSAENVVTAVGGVGSPLGENLAESASIGRRLQQVGATRGAGG